MQAVNVLSDDREHFAGLFEPHDGVIHGIGLCVAECLPTLELVIPVLDASGFVAHEIVIINRLAPFPYPLRAAEVGNAACRRDTGAGKD